MDKQNNELPMGAKTLIDFGEYILAERSIKGTDKTEYITWHKNPKGGVGIGHYFTDLQAAKEDFVCRTELVSLNKLFTENELAMLYKALTVYEQSTQIDYDNKELCDCIENIGEKLNNIPNIDKYTKIKVLIVPVDETPYVKMK